MRASINDPSQLLLASYNKDLEKKVDFEIEFLEQEPNEKSSFLTSFLKWMSATLRARATSNYS